MKRKYRIAPTSAFSEEKSSKFLLLEGRQKEPRVDIKSLSKSQVDSELTRMRNMTAQEAAAFAAQAVAEAEAAMAEAEQAAREAEVAEADAEAAQAFAEAAMLTLKNRNATKRVIFLPIVIILQLSDPTCVNYHDSHLLDPYSCSSLFHCFVSSQVRSCT